MTAKNFHAFGAFRLNPQQKILLRDGERIPLHPKTYTILLALLETSGEVISKDDLMERVWPGTFVEESSLTKNISLLRKALSNGHDHSDYIETIPTIGYRFTESVQWVEIGQNGDGANVRQGDAAKIEDELPLLIADRSTSDHHMTLALQPKQNRWVLAAILFVFCAAGVFVAWKTSSSRSAAPPTVKDEFAPIQLTHHFAEDLQPAWSSDGKRIAFASNRDGQPAVFLMNADGSGVQKLNNGLSRSDAKKSLERRIGA